MNLHVGGKIIRTTAEHPYYVYNKVCGPCGELQIGDVLSSHDGQRVIVEGVATTIDLSRVTGNGVLGVTEMGRDQWLKE